MKILVVDDEKDVGDLIKYYFQQKGAEVYAYTDSSVAQQEVLRKKPDIIITDWLMPGLTGKDLLKSFKENNKTKSTPVIMLSCMTDFSEISNLFRGGLDDYLVKPINMKKLYDVVVDHYENSKKKVS